ARRQQREEWRQRLNGDEPPSRRFGRQYFIAGAIVIIAVHPRDRHEMWELPQKYDDEEDERLATDSALRRGPSDERRHGARNRADDGAQRCDALGWCVEKQITRERRER